MAHTFNCSTLEFRDRKIYVASSGSARDMYYNSVSKKGKKRKRTLEPLVFLGQR